MHPHRSSVLRYAPAAQAVHSRVYGGCTAEAAASAASGPRVSGCIRESTELRPHPGTGREGAGGRRPSSARRGASGSATMESRPAGPGCVVVAGPHTMAHTHSIP